MFKLLLIASVVICNLYLFHIISLLNPDSKLVNNLISSSLDKVTTGTYNLQAFIASVAPVVVPFTTGGPAVTCLCSKLVITQFLFHFSSKNTSQLINGMFNALQKLPKYFNGIANSTSCLPILFATYSIPILFYYIICITSYFIFILKSIRSNYICVRKFIRIIIIT